MIVSSSRNKNQILLVSFMFYTVKCGTQIYAQGDSEITMPFNFNEIETKLDYRPNELSKDENLERVSNMLAKLLLVPWPDGAKPLLYVEQQPYGGEEDEHFGNEAFDKTGANEEPLRPMSLKRSKYYRKYPWKRQNNRYEPPYMCSPEKDDVFRLLVALHGERNGNKRGRMVDFCNRRRPTSVVFTNIRYVG